MRHLCKDSLHKWSCWWGLLGGQGVIYICTHRYISTSAFYICRSWSTYVYIYIYGRIKKPPDPPGDPTSRTTYEGNPFITASFLRFLWVEIIPFVWLWEGHLIIIQRELFPPTEMANMRHWWRDSLHKWSCWWGPLGGQGVSLYGLVTSF